MTTVRTFGIATTSDSGEDYRLIDSGLLVPVSALNARSGVTSVPTLTGTGNFTCNIGAFTAAIDGTSNALQGVYRIAVDGSTPITISAASAQARIDLIYAQILDKAYDGSGQALGQVQYLAGTAGSGSAPATPANAIPLFTVPVAANATSVVFANAAAVFPFTAAIGGIVPVRSASDKPAAASGVQYRHRLDVSAGSGASPLEWSTDGTTYTPTYDPAAAYGSWTATTLGSLFAVFGGTTPQYRTAPGSRVELRGVLVTTTSVADNNGVLGALPIPASSRGMRPAINGSPDFLLFIQAGQAVATNRGGNTLPNGTVIYLDGLSYTL